VHLFAEEAGPDSRDAVAFPWGKVRAVFEDAPGDSSPEGGAALGLEFITAIIHRHRTFYDQPRHPVRRLLVKAMAACLPPWPGDLTQKRRQHLLELLEHVPMFRSRAGAPLSLNELVRRLSRGVKTELELSEEEAALVERLCPGRSRTSVKVLPSAAVLPPMRPATLPLAPEPRESAASAPPPGLPVAAAVAEDLAIRPEQAPAAAAPWEDLVIRAEPPPQAAPAPAPSQAPQPQESEEVATAQRLLRRLKGKVGSRVAARLSPHLRLELAQGGAPLALEETGAWTLRGRNALVAVVLAAKLEPREKAAYLASLAFTAANRILPDVTDTNDSEFQQVLAEELCGPQAAGPAGGEA
jgi:hypothetical protein